MKGRSKTFKSSTAQGVFKNTISRSGKKRFNGGDGLRETQSYTPEFGRAVFDLSLIHISEPTRLALI
eukprot:13377375-Alexandrium_andersonii.AAC.1